MSRRPLLNVFLFAAPILLGLGALYAFWAVTHGWQVELSHWKLLFVLPAALAHPVMVHTLALGYHPYGSSAIGPPSHAPGRGRVP